MNDLYFQIVEKIPLLVRPLLVSLVYPFLTDTISSTNPHGYILYILDRNLQKSMAHFPVFD